MAGEVPQWSQGLYEKVGGLEARMRNVEAEMAGFRAEIAGLRRLVWGLMGTTLLGPLLAGLLWHGL